MYVFLIVSLLIALWLSNPTISKKNKIYRYVIVLLGLVMIVPNTQSWHWNGVKTPKFFRDKNIIKKFINKGDNVLIFPYNNGYGGTLDYYQAVSDMYFKMPEGRLTYIPENFSKWPAFYMFLSNSISGNYVLQISAFIGSKNIKAVVLTPGASKIWYSVFNRMKWKKIKTGGVVLYEVPKIVLQKFKYITTSQIAKKYYLHLFNGLYNSSNKFLNRDELLSKPYPEYLENQGYLSKSFGYTAGRAYNWTKNGGWIGRWGCPDGKGECFGVCITGNINNLKPILKKYRSKAIQIFFPYPKIYNVKSSKGSGELLMIFKINK